MSDQVDFNKIDIGCGIEVPKGRFNGGTAYHVIIGIDNDDGYTAVPVYRMGGLDELYMNSDDPRDKDNVPLWSCPPPFTGLKGDVYAFARLSNSAYFSKSDFETLGIEISDNYAKVSDHDMKLIFDHDLEQMQEELIFKEQNIYTRELPFVDSNDDNQSSFDLNF